MIFTYILGIVLGIVLGIIFLKLKIKELKKEYSSLIQEWELENTSLRIELEKIKDENASLRIELAEIKDEEKLSYEEQLFYD